MKAQEIRELSDQEIQKKLRDSRDQLLHLRLRKKTAPVENPARFRSLRRDIARMETLLREKQLMKNKVETASAK